MIFRPSLMTGSAGISVGTNAIQVFEHAGYYMPTLLSHNMSISTWTHFAIVYDKGRVCSATLVSRCLGSFSFSPPSMSMAAL